MSYYKCKITVAAFLSTMIFMSCKYASKNTITLKLDIALLSKPDFCKNNKLSDDIISLYKPIELSNNKIGSFKGSIYQFASFPLSTLSISGSNNDWIKKTKKTLIGDKETIDQAELNYQEYISSLSIDSLCAVSNINSINSFNEFSSANHYSNIFVLSNKLTDTSWNNIKVFKDLNALKETVYEIFKAANQSNILIIMDPVFAQEPAGPKITDLPNTLPPQPPHSTLDSLFKIVVSASNSEKIREGALKELLDKYFAKEFYVVMRNDTRNGTPRQWDPVDGIKYLQHLVIDNSITSLEFLDIRKNTTDGKISGIELIEKHNR